MRWSYVGGIRERDRDKDTERDDQEGLQFPSSSDRHFDLCGLLQAAFKLLESCILLKSSVNQ